MTGLVGDTEARHHCAFFYDMLGAEWAIGVNCSALPDSLDDSVCVGGREVLALAQNTGTGSQLYIELSLINLLPYSFYSTADILS